MNLTSRIEEFQHAVASASWTTSEWRALSSESAIGQILDRLISIRHEKRRLYVIGNGGSAAIAAHVANDFVNMLKISAFTLHESAILTCMTNDFGYENAYGRMLSQHVGPGDFLIAISSSGKSKNILNAIQEFRIAGGKFVLTLSGFTYDNPLRPLGDVNIWIDSADYGIVEVGHQFILHHLSDRLALNK